MRPSLARLKWYAGLLPLAASTALAGPAHPQSPPPAPVAFGARTTLQAPAGAAEFRVADLDGDGRLDVSVIGSGEVRVFRNETPSGAVSPRFGSPVSVPYVPGELGVPALAIGDVDGDGRPDLVGGKGTIGFARNTGTGPFLGFAPFADLGIATDACAVEVIDIDDDGLAELIVATELDVVKVAFNETPPGSPLPAFRRTDWPTGASVERGDTRGRISLATADFNRDGRPDFVTTNVVPESGPSGETLPLTTTVLATARSPFSDDLTFFAPQIGAGDAAYACAAGEATLDAKPDVAVLIRDAFTQLLSVVFWTNASQLDAASVQFVGDPPFPVDASTSDIAFADLNGDAAAELLVAGSPGTELEFAL